MSGIIFPDEVEFIKKINKELHYTAKNMWKKFSSNNR